MPRFCDKPERREAVDNSEIHNFGLTPVISA